MEGKARKGIRISKESKKFVVESGGGGEDRKTVPPTPRTNVFKERELRKTTREYRLENKGKASKKKIRHSRLPELVMCIRVRYMIGSSRHLPSPFVKSPFASPGADQRASRTFQFRKGSRRGIKGG